jgi:hypothetical protein
MLFVSFSRCSTLLCLVNGCRTTLLLQPVADDRNDSRFVSRSLASQGGVGDGTGVTARNLVLYEFPQFNPRAQEP